MQIQVEEPTEIWSISSEKARKVKKMNNSIILFPTLWDDFGFKTEHISYYITENGEVIDLGAVKIGKKGLKPYERLDTIDYQSSELFSVGGEDYYNNVYNNLKIGVNEDIFRDYLASMNDIIYNKGFYKDIENEFVFKTSLTRDIAFGDIKKTFGYILDGVEPRTEYNIEYSIQHKKSLKREEDPVIISISVDPEKYAPTNIHVIIGRNGVGKTTILYKISEKMIYRTDTNNEDDFIIEYKNNSQKEFSTLITVAFSPYDTKYPQEEERIFSDIEYNHIGINNIKNSEEHGIEESFDNCINRDFHYNFNKLAGNNKKKISIYLECLNILGNDPIFKKSNIEYVTKKYINKRSSDNIDIKDVVAIFKRMSSGHKSVLRTITRMINCVSVNSLILIDEPENHLHPPLLSAFIHALAYLLKSQNSVALVSTHSPVVLQEVPKKCVYKINRDEYTLTATHPKIETLGENVGILTHEVFELEVTNTGFYSLLEKLASDSENYKDALNKLDNRLGAEGRVFLRGLVHEKNRERQENMD
ncbi:AAA family ATPase [Rothia dentocariosa]|jgi:hypothetical protein|uniref:AAA family ATPase n=1 Tax=Rothia dentocariosa TaxID=2047 RepID=UPI00119C9C88